MCIFLVYLWCSIVCSLVFCVTPCFSFCSGKTGLPDPKVLVEKLLKRTAFRPDPQGSNLMFAFFAQHFTHQFFKTYNHMGLGFTKALGHGVSPCKTFILQPVKCLEKEKN